jgi:hypothetical protein
MSLQRVIKPTRLRNLIKSKFKEIANAYSHYEEQLQKKQHFHGQIAA